ncbi:MAG TPA: UbiA family prenyltransferase [Egibacteraceae bacterium]
MSGRPDARTLAELVRLPAVLSVPGDVVVGAGAVGDTDALKRAVGLAASSSLLYLAGMALNDYADREEDARERPQRPIPSGRVSPGFALGLAGCLTAAAVGLAGVAGGRRALRISLPLAAAVWAYDLALKQTPAGPAAMALTRGLDVLLGASAGPLRRALPAAGVIGAQTLVVTTLSRRETTGATAGFVRGTMAATAGVAAAAGAVAAGGHGVPAGARATALGLIGAYAASVLRAQADAAADPSPGRLQRAVGRGIMGLLPLQAGLMAARVPRPVTAAIAAAWPLAQRLSRRKAVT